MIFRKNRIENEDPDILKMVIKCICGREAILNLVGGQYQNSYIGECECGRKWSLEEHSGKVRELSSEWD